MFLMEKDKALTVEKVSQIIQTFETGQKAKLRRYYNYYSGKQLITTKVVVDESKP